MTQQDWINGATYLIQHWQLIAAYSVGGLSISIILQWIKRKFKLDERLVKITRFIRLDGPRIIVIILTIFTGIGTAVDWLIDPGNARYIPERYVGLLAAAFYIHRFIVSPAGQKISNWLELYVRAVRMVEQQAVAREATTSPKTPQSAQITPTQQIQPTLNPQVGQIFSPTNPHNQAQ